MDKEREEKLISQGNILGIIERDDSAEYLAELLMDDSWSTYKMYEGLVSSWLGGSEEYRKGLDDALMTVTGWKLSSITVELLKRAKEKGVELDKEILALIDEQEGKA